MRINGLLIVLFLCGIRSGAGAVPEDDFAQANDYYHKQAYREAIELYEGILESGYESGVLYYNLGNAYYKADSLPAAIWAYERARRLGLEGEDIRFNLAKLYAEQTDNIRADEATFFESVRDGLTSSGWAYLSIGLAVLLVVAVYGFIYGTPGTKRLGFFGGLLMLLLLAATLATGYWRLRYEQSRFAVMFKLNTTVYAEADQDSKALFAVAEGLKVEIKDEQGAWVRIRLADGQRGWVPAATLKAI